MTNTTFRNRKRNFQRRLTDAQCAQIDQWLIEDKLTYFQIMALVAEQFKFKLSAPTLSRRNADLITKRDNEEREAAAKAASDPTPKAPAEILSKVEKRAIERLDDPKTDWTPGRLLQVQRIVLEPWRRQITENRERRADELKEIADRNTKLKEDIHAWQQKCALIKWTTPKGELPDESLIETHPLNQRDPIDTEDGWSEAPAELSPSSLSNRTIDQLPIGQSYSIPTSLPPMDFGDDFGLRQLAAALEPSPNTETTKQPTTLPAEPSAQREPLTSNFGLPTSNLPPDLESKLRQHYKPQTVTDIKTALRLKPDWKVPTNPTELHAACTAYAQLRHDEKFPKRGPRVTQYKYCPCGGPVPCPIHGSFPNAFWEADTCTETFLFTMQEKGLDFKFPNNSGSYVLIEPEDNQGHGEIRNIISF